MRQKIVAGNWKMNKTLEEATALASEVMGMVADEVSKSDLLHTFSVPAAGEEPAGQQRENSRGRAELQRT